MSIKIKSIDPERVSKIERNMKFVVAIEAALNGLERRAASFRADPAESFGIRVAVSEIRKVITEHVE
jgi:hypothetical protein